MGVIPKTMRLVSPVSSGELCPPNDQTQPMIMGLALADVKCFCRKTFGFISKKIYDTAKIYLR